MTENEVFTTSKGNRINLSLYGFDHTDAPCIIYVHGFKGFKDWGFVPVTGQYLAAMGYRMLTFNFSHNGIGDNPVEFTELEKFRDNTFSLELSEAREVIQAYHQGRIFGVQPHAAIGLLGHSRGGGIALLAGQASPEVQAVCTWAAVSTFRHYPPQTIAQWEKDGVLPIVNSRTGQVMELGWGIHEDLMEHIDGRLNIERATREMGKPLCVIHGTKDPAVSIEDGMAIAGWAGDHLSRFEKIQGADHVFGARHPFETSNPDLDHVWQVTLDFFQTHLPNPS